MNSNIKNFTDFKNHKEFGRAQESLTPFAIEAAKNPAFYMGAAALWLRQMLSNIPEDQGRDNSIEHVLDLVDPRRPK